MATALRFAAGSRTKTKRAGRRLDALAVDVERGAAVQDDVELLLSGRGEPDLVVLANDVSVVGDRPERVDPERLDVEVPPDG